MNFQQSFFISDSDLPILLFLEHEVDAEIIETNLNAIVEISNSSLIPQLMLKHNLLSLAH